MFAVFVVFEYSDIRPAALKIITPTSASHKMASSVAFLTRPALRLLKVTHRWRSFGIFSIFIFFRPMLRVGAGGWDAGSRPDRDDLFVSSACQ